jgi:hypothetical protein
VQKNADLPKRRFTGRSGRHAAAGFQSQRSKSKEARPWFAFSRHGRMVAWRRGHCFVAQALAPTRPPSRRHISFPLAKWELLPAPPRHCRARRTFSLGSRLAEARARARAQTMETSRRSRAPHGGERARPAPTASCRRQNPSAQPNRQQKTVVPDALPSDWTIHPTREPIKACLTTRHLIKPNQAKLSSSHSHEEHVLGREVENRQRDRR